MKQKYVFVAYSDGGKEVFNTDKEASQFAHARNMENDNWKSIKTKWWVTKWPANQPIND